jgi:hypothetical protein
MMKLFKHSLPAHVPDGSVRAFSGGRRERSDALATRFSLPMLSAGDAGR